MVLAHRMFAQSLDKGRHVWRYSGGPVSVVQPPGQAIHNMTLLSQTLSLAAADHAETRGNFPLPENLLNTVGNLLSKYAAYHDLKNALLWNTS